MTHRSTCDDDGIKSVERSFSIVEAITELGDATVSELSTHLDMSQSTVYYHVNTLAEMGYLQKDDNSYSVGLRFLVFGGHSRKNLDFFEFSKSEVDNLADRDNVVASACVEEGGKRLVLYRCEGEKAVWDNSPVGDHEYMHRTASGKAMLGFFDKKHVDEIVETHGLPPATEHTITNRSELEKARERIRDRGFALNDEENTKGLRGIAVPVMPNNDVIGTISMAGPKKALLDDELQGLADDLESAVNAIELLYQHY